MRLLIITQKVDISDPILGFFHRWIEEFAKNFEKVTVICLEKGESRLPAGIKVLSLGKESGASKLKYFLKFHYYIWKERSNYDAVFVHMNQEYALMAGDIWKLWGKKIYLWRNHSKGNLFTRLAVLFSDKVFYTSPSSFTARFRKSVRMPVGIDTDFFKPDPSVVRMPNSILFLGRIAPVKKALEFVDWLKNQDFEIATIAGPSLPKDASYEEEVRKKVAEYGLEPKVKFTGAVTQQGALKLYQSHEAYVNKTPAGSFDKTIVEAAACGMKLIVDNPDAKNINVEEHSLKKLMEKLVEEMVQ